MLFVSLLFGSYLVTAISWLLLLLFIVCIRVTPMAPGQTQGTHTLYEKQPLTSEATALKDKMNKGRKK